MKFQYCPMCARDLVKPETPQEDPDHPEFEPVLRRCSGCGGPWPTCKCDHAAEGPPGPDEETKDDFGFQRAAAQRHASAAFVSDVAGKIRRGELGPVDAALVVTVDSQSAPPRLGTALYRLDQKGGLWVLDNLASSIRAQEQRSSGGIIIPR